jgi:integrase
MTKQSKLPPTTLKELTRVAIEPLWRGKSYYRTVVANLDEAIKIMGDPLLSSIDTDMVAEYAYIMTEKVKPSTVNRKLSNLHTILKYAYDREWIDRMPKMPWMKEDNERIRWLSKEEEAQLLALLPQPYSAFCEILIHTGMRRGELLNLKSEDVDGNYARLWKTKTKKARSVPLSDRAKELINQYVPFNIELNHLRSAWLKAKKEMGLEDDPHFVMHTLRHTTATRMLDTTGNIAVVQRMLGHAKIATTMRYAHVSDDALLNAVRQTSIKHSPV